MTKQEKEIKKDEAKIELKKYLKPQDTILIIIKKVSSNGMNRRMKVLDKEFNDLTYNVAHLIDSNNNGDGVLISGCGMDMCFHLADLISRNLWGSKPLKSYKGNGGSCINCKYI